MTTWGHGVFFIPFPFRSFGEGVYSGNIFPPCFEMKCAFWCYISRFTPCFRTGTFLIYYSYMYPKRTFV